MERDGGGTPPGVVTGGTDGSGSSVATPDRSPDVPRPGMQSPSATGRAAGGAPGGTPLGLTDAEAAARRAAGQGNDVRARTSRTYWEILWQNAYLGINGPLIVIALLLLIAGMPVDAALTACPVIANIAIGVVQEARAKQQLDRIALLNRPKAIVVRDGAEREVDPAELVVGDVVVARRGDQIVVDGTIVGSGRAELDESLLTGESDPVSKDRGDDVYSGTAVVSGTLTYETEKVGEGTVANRLLGEARGMHDDQTPLQRGIATTIWAIAGLVVLVGALVAVTGLPGDSFSSRETLRAAGVLVTLVPQGLAIMVTVTYAAGALRVTRLGALVQRRNAVESMSRVDTLCVDKTGTLTTQRISFAGLEPLGTWAVSTATVPNATAAVLRPVDSALGTVAASTRAPNRTTEALATTLPAPALALDDEIPFSSERRWSALRFALPTPPDRAPEGESGDEGRGLRLRPGSVFVLGAPAALAPSLAHQADPVTARAATIAEGGVRVLLAARAADGCALRDPEGRPTLPPSLEPVALLSFVEELRPDARETLAEIAAAGVDLKVISGDDPSTVEAIARRVGLELDAPAVSGVDLAALDDAALEAAVGSASVFGRVEPNLKARLVAALRARGRYVAMIGDGVNDLLPLRRAHLGIAMESGSAATRGAADLILLGDAFAVLPKAVVEGQRILAAMEATLIILLARTFYVLLIVAGAALAGLPFPFTPRQNSALAFATVGIPLIVLALWVPPKRSPRNLVLETLRISIPASFAVAALALPVYAAAVEAGGTVAETQSILTTLTVFCGLGLLPLIYPAEPDPSMSRLMRAWPWLLSVLMAIVYIVILELPIAREFYELVKLPIETIVALLLLGIAWTGAIHLIRRTHVVRAAEDLLVALVLRAVPAASHLGDADRH
jgi:cation-transporting ATPase E